MMPLLLYFSLKILRRLRGGIRERAKRCHFSIIFRILYYWSSNIIEEWTLR